MKNGTIYGAAADGVELCASSRVEDVQVIGVYANQYFENQRSLGPNLCDGTVC